MPSSRCPHGAWLVPRAGLVSQTDRSSAPDSCTWSLATWPLASHSTSLSFSLCICRTGMKIVPIPVRSYLYHRSLERRVSIEPSFPGSTVFFLGTMPPSLPFNSEVPLFLEEELLLSYRKFMGLRQGAAGREGKGMQSIVK